MQDAEAGRKAGKGAPWALAPRSLCALDLCQSPASLRQNERASPWRRLICSCEVPKRSAMTVVKGGLRGFNQMGHLVGCFSADGGASSIHALRRRSGQD